METKELRRVYLDTLKIVADGKYTACDGSTVVLPDNSTMLAGTKFYTQRIDATSVPCREFSTEIKVFNTDSIKCGRMLLDESLNPVVLNLADRFVPGGAVLNGSRAQEESLFRSTNLFLSMYRFKKEYAALCGLEAARQQYPMPRRFGGIYVPNATVFRDGVENKFALLPHPYSLSFVSVAAISGPRLTEEGLLTEEDADLTKDKMRTILRIGLLNGHDSIVLGAFGCGAFHNPPRHITRLFHEVFEEKEFKNKYRRIAFAILDDHNAPAGGNFAPFKEEFA